MYRIVDKQLTINSSLHFSSQMFLFTLSVSEITHFHYRSYTLFSVLVNGSAPQNAVCFSVFKVKLIFFGTERHHPINSMIRCHIWILHELPIHADECWHGYDPIIIIYGGQPGKLQLRLGHDEIDREPMRLTYMHKNNARAPYLSLLVLLSTHGE